VAHDVAVLKRESFSPDNIDGLNRLGLVTMRQGAYDSADRYFQHAHSIYVEEFGRERPKTQTAQDSMLDAQEKTE